MTPSPTPTSSAPWWRDSVCYQIYVRSFADADGNGTGDLPGITARLDHLVDLGVDALWITPFYPSPQHDHGYDVADYRDVDPRFGTLADFDALAAGAHERGLKVIVDLVPNHTSWDHAWFREALASAPGSPARDRYLFRDGRGPGGTEPPNNWISVFGGPAWERAEDGQWYLHLFDRSQPDLNWSNPEVRADFERTLRFWLDRGVDGFRVDVAHGLVKEEGLPDVADPEAYAHGTEPGGPMWDQPAVHEIYREWHRLLASYDGDRMAVAEAWAPTPESTARYVRSDELQQAFNFHWLEAPWSAKAFRDVVTTTLTSMDAVGASATWVLENHDVVRVATRYGGGDRGRARARAAALAMLALPGSAYLYQGQELGLEQVEVPAALKQDPEFLNGRGPGRDGCRVPIPWSGQAPSYGFGPGTESWLPQPAVFGERSVAAQSADDTSTLAFFTDLLRARRGLDQSVREVTWPEAPDDVLLFERGDVLVALNAGDRLWPLPEGRQVLHASGELAGGASQSLPPDTAAWLR